MNKTILSLIPVILLCFSCSDKKMMSTLNDIESLLYDAPDSALLVLDSMSSSDITTNRARAKYSLLYSIALDKNYIDLTTDSIISPAVRWYKYHGTPDEKLKTNYYLGRIYGNSNDRENEMKCYVKAERFTNKASDLTSSGMLYSAKGAIYSDIYDIEDAIYNFSLAAEFYKKADNRQKYINTVLQLSTLYLQFNARDSALSQLRVLEKFLKDMSDVQKSDYYSTLLTISPSDNVVNTYLSDIRDSSLVNWMSIAHWNNISGNTADGINALDLYGRFNTDYQSSGAYWAIYSNLLHMSGDDKDAYLALEHYVDITDKDDIEIFWGNTKAIEDSEIANYKNQI